MSSDASSWVSRHKVVTSAGILLVMTVMVITVIVGF